MERSPPVLTGEQQADDDYYESIELVKARLNNNNKINGKSFSRVTPNDHNAPSGTNASRVQPETDATIDVDASKSDGSCESATPSTVTPSSGYDSSIYGNCEELFPGNWKSLAASYGGDASLSEADHNLTNKVKGDGIDRQTSNEDNVDNLGQKETDQRPSPGGGSRGLRQTFVAMYAYDADDGDYSDVDVEEILTFDLNEVIYFMGERRGRWMKGQLKSTGEIGWFPSTHVREGISAMSILKTVALSKPISRGQHHRHRHHHQRDATGLSHSFDETDDDFDFDEDGEENTVRTAQSPSESASTDSFYVAIYPYAATHDGDVSFNANDVIRLIDVLDNGWWRGTVISSGQTGLFPGSYVESIDSSNKRNSDAVAGSSSLKMTGSLGALKSGDPNNVKKRSKQRKGERRAVSEFFATLPRRFVWSPQSRSVFDDESVYAPSPSPSSATVASETKSSSVQGASTDKIKKQKKGAAAVNSDEIKVTTPEPQPKPKRQAPVLQADWVNQAGKVSASAEGTGVIGNESNASSLSAETTVLMSEKLNQLLVSKQLSTPSEGSGTVQNATQRQPLASSQQTTPAAGSVPDTVVLSSISSKSAKTKPVKDNDEKQKKKSMTLPHRRFFSSTDEKSEKKKTKSKSRPSLGVVMAYDGGGQAASAETFTDSVDNSSRPDDSRKSTPIKLETANYMTPDRAPVTAAGTFERGVSPMLTVGAANESDDGATSTANRFRKKTPIVKSLKVDAPDSPAATAAAAATDVMLSPNANVDSVSSDLTKKLTNRRSPVAAGSKPPPILPKPASSLSQSDDGRLTITASTPSLVQPTQLTASSPNEGSLAGSCVILPVRPEFGAPFAKPPRRGRPRQATDDNEATAHIDSSTSRSVNVGNRSSADSDELVSEQSASVVEIKLQPPVTSSTGTGNVDAIQPKDESSSRVEPPKRAGSKPAPLKPKPKLNAVTARASKTIMPVYTVDIDI